MKLVTTAGIIVYAVILEFEYGLDGTNFSPGSAARRAGGLPLLSEG
jgi:hypothetical protein